MRIWEFLSKVVKTLGTDGMSSDDTCIDDHEKVYHVKTLPWRRELDSYMDIIDNQRRIPDEKFAEAGSTPVKRLRGKKLLTSSREAVKGLPKALYDRDWIKRQDQSYLDVVVEISDVKFPWLKLKQASGRNN